MPYQTTPTRGLDLLARKYTVEKVREKSERYPVHLTDSHFSMLDFPDSLITWGSSSAFVQPHGGKAYRVLDTRRCIELEDGLWATPMDVVRYYLDWKYDRLPLRARGKALDKCRAPKRKAPGYAVPWQGMASYYDLKSAYWSITQAVGWDVAYSPGSYLRRGPGLYDFPFWWHKVARNTLVSIGIQGKIKQYDSATRQYTTKTVGNRYRNIMLWSLVCDVLNAIAIEALAHGAVYVNTDGYIIPDNRAGHALDAMRAWGFPIATDHSGQTEVRYLGSYRVGEHVTGHWLTPAHFSRVQLPVDIDWLRQKVSACANSRTFINAKHVR